MPRSRSLSTARTGGRRTPGCWSAGWLLDPEQVSADPRSRRRRTLHPDQRALPLPELAQRRSDLRLLLHLDEPGRDCPGPGGRGGALVPAPHHGGEHLPRQQARRRPPASPVRIPPGQHWPGCGARCSPRAWPPGCTSSPPAPLGQDILHGHGVRGGKAMIATLRWRLIAVPGRLIRHARHLVLRLPPGHGLLPEVLARLRELPSARSQTCPVPSEERVIPGRSRPVQSAPLPAQVGVTVEFS